MLQIPPISVIFYLVLVETMNRFNGSIKGDWSLFDKDADAGDATRCRRVTDVQ
jgi:hypothetical protein